jgi:hypothetical protein
LKKAVKSLSENPTKPLSEASSDFFDELLEYAQSVGVDIVGFTKLQREEIFQKQGILHENAVRVNLSLKAARGFNCGFIFNLNTL